MMANLYAQFAVFDVDKSGYLTPDEVIAIDRKSVV